MPDTSHKLAISKEASRIGILAGGSAEERQLSLQGSKCILEALQSKGYTQVSIINVSESPDTRGDLIRSLLDVDVAFVCLHGAFGEDGVIQGILEGLRVPYTFSGPFTGTVGSDKILSKRYLSGCGAIEPVPGGTIFSDQPLPDVLPAAFPMMLKDPTLGCSKGVWRCNSMEELARCLKLCKSREVLVEQFVVGTDIVCCCVEIDGELTVWPVVEFDMDPCSFQDLASKNALWGWADDGDGSESSAPPPPPVIKRCPATRVPPSICIRAQQHARRIFTDMRASGALNVEFRVALSDSGSEENAHMYFIEMSVVPALTDMSVHACCARAGGMEYPDLVECWLKTASLKSLE